MFTVNRIFASLILVLVISAQALSANIPGAENTAFKTTANSNCGDRAYLLSPGVKFLTAKDKILIIDAIELNSGLPKLAGMAFYFSEIES